MGDYLKEHGTRTTPQSEPMRDDQVVNSAGGYAWAVDPLTRLRRFLILGSEGGSYYAGERELTKENVDIVRWFARESDDVLVREIVEVSRAGRAPKNDPALFALAVAISSNNPDTKRAAAEALPLVARTGTHLFHFVAYAETQRGWGATLRWAVGNWYESQEPDALAYQVVKYRQRDRWSHRDLLRLAHPSGRTEQHKKIYDWVAHGLETQVGEIQAIINRATDRDSALEDVRALLETQALPLPITMFEAAQRAESPEETAAYVRAANLPREALKPEHLTSPDVWRALLDEGVPFTALVRNLANMTRIGVIDGDYRGLVLDRLADVDLIRKSRIHPLQVLMALRTYAQGVGFRGSNVWTPIPQVTDALDAAFYTAFGNVPSTGKRILLALDVSGSMGMGQVAGTPLTPRDASAALALVTLNTERDVDVVGFSHQLIPLGLSGRQRLDDAIRVVSGIPFGATDCSLPMQWAEKEGRDYDAFVVLTDSETWYGDIHPAQALVRYRQMRSRPARLAVIGMTANGFSIADPNDAGMLDLVGFDTATPQLLSEFMAGRI